MLLCLASLKGSPGVTTLAVALAARWPQPWRRVLVEADPAGGDLAARYRLPVTPGLVSLAAAARRSTDPELVGEHAQLLPGGLPVVVGPTRADQARAALTTIAAADGQAGVLGSFTGRHDLVAVVDCGRLDPDSPASAIVSAADQLLILARPRADELAHVADHLAAEHRGVPGGPARTRLLLVGPGYPGAEVEREVGLAVAGSLPWDTRTAAAMCGRAATLLRPRAALVRTATRLAGALAADPRRLPADEVDETADETVDVIFGGGVPRLGKRGSTSTGWPSTSSNGTSAVRWSRP